MQHVHPARHLLRAKDLIDARYREPLDVRDASRAPRTSPPRTSAASSAATFGEPPHQYLLTRRLERAAALLRNTDRTVSDICLRVGLRSVGSFTTSFGRAYGLSPTAYRAAHPPAVAHVRIPTCVLQAYARPQSSRFGEDSRGVRRLASQPTAHDIGGSTMLKQLTHTQVWVHDQDEALAFYTEKLGMELREDVTVPEMGNFRWLSVGVPGQPDVSITLMAVPGPPVFDEETRAQIQALLAKGAAGGLFFATDDSRRATRS